jgi:3-methyladenine DNA glycosylase AlkD
MRENRNDASLTGMAKYGIRVDRTFGISMGSIENKAKEIGKDHELAIGLWNTGFRDARLLAVLIDDANRVTEGQMESWVADIDSWDICDGLCIHLFRRTPFALGKAKEWAGREKEFQRRAGFVLMATLAVHAKTLPPSEFDAFLDLVEEHCTDERNYVRKAVNWALRQIGKRDEALNRKAIDRALRIERKDSKAARWVAKDALRELESEKVRTRLKKGRMEMV